LFPILGTLEGEIVPLLLFTAVVIIWSVFSLQDSVLTGLGQAQWVSLENTAVSVIKIILLIWLAQSLPGAGVLTAWLIPVVLSLLPINLLIFHRLLPRHKQTTLDQAEPLTLRPIVKYVAGNHLAALFLLAYTTLLPVIVASQAGVRANAYFYLPWMIASSLQLVALNMTTSLTVEATRNRSQLRGYGHRMFVHLMQILIPVVAIVFVGAPWILRIFGEAYAIEGTALLRWLVLALLPNAIIVLYIALARVHNRVAGIIAVQGVSCVLVLSLTFGLFDSYDITGVGIAWLASQTIVATGLLPVLLRDWRQEV
jgi:O-antigen/teichoic acid export membrane protein